MASHALQPLLGTGLAAAAAAGVAYAADLPPLASPTFYSEGRNVYFCEGDGGLLPLTFNKDGTMVVAEVGGSHVGMQFSRTSFEDTYQAEGWMLTLDPDAMLLGPNGFRRTNCS
jgi:hypothetical protein